MIKKAGLVAAMLASGVSYAVVFTTAAAQSADLLPSWNEGKTKQSILDFVARVTTQGSPQFVRPAERIATFDNDGTLWAEQPLYFQLAFAIDRVGEEAAKHLGARLGAFIHHTDAEREWAYDRTSSIGRLDKGLDEAEARGWVIVSMKEDWKIIYPSPRK